MAARALEAALLHVGALVALGVAQARPPLRLRNLHMIASPCKPCMHLVRAQQAGRAPQPALVRRGLEPSNLPLYAFGLDLWHPELASCGSSDGVRKIYRQNHHHANLRGCMLRCVRTLQESKSSSAWQYVSWKMGVLKGVAYMSFASARHNALRVGVMCHVSCDMCRVSLLSHISQSSSQAPRN
jgi:hypothetical protein